ncbi:MAG: DNA polymerase I [Bacteroidales bacterium]|nr:DNA polymerase I [Bacteroidales bacterium]
MNKRLFLLDAYALIYRSYYAFIKNPRINSKGENTSAIFGFLNTLEDLLRKENPTHLAVAFDPSGKTFRHEAFEAYKAQREETPETIRWSIPFIKDILKAYDIPIIEICGFEADDVIGSLSKIAVNKGFDVYMMTPDKDYGQLVNEHCFIYKPRYGSSDFDILGPNEVCEKFGLSYPLQVIDYLSLMGDSSDNIPGCPGVGKVRAQKLIEQFGCIENLLENTDQLKGSLKENVENNKETIIFSKFLATIKTDIEIDFDEEDFKVVKRNEEKVIPIFERLEFRSWINRISATSRYNEKTENTSQRENPNKKITEVNFLSGVAGVTEKISAKKQREETEIILDGKNIIFKNDSNPSLKKIEIQKKEDAVQLDLFGEPIVFGETSAEPDLFSNFFVEEIGNAVQTSEKNSNLKASNLLFKKLYILDNESFIEDFLQKISVCKKFSFSIAIDHFEVMSNKMLGIAFCLSKNEAYFLPFSKNFSEDKNLLKKFQKVFENEEIEKIGHQLKSSIVLLKRYGISVKGNLFDTSIAHYLLQPELKHQQDYLAEIFLNYHCIAFDSLFDEKLKEKSLASLPYEKYAYYLAEKACVDFYLYDALKDKIKEENLDYLCYEVEMPLIYVLADMEFTGVSIDTEALKNIAFDLHEKLSIIEKEIYRLAEEEFNINSPKKVGEILFDKLQIPAKVKKTKTNKQYSTSEDLLQSIKDKHPIIPLLLDYRGIKKLLGTYIEAFPLLINKETGKIHTSFNQSITATGRLSSSNPNLQNIPIRDELGKEMRKVFSVEDGYYFLSADYSQVELRIMAHLAQDENMIEAFKSGKDIHQATAARIFNLPLDEVDADMRRKAKTANFGIIYGISTFGLAERMNVSRTEAKNIIEEYFQKYAAIKQYMDKAIADAKENLFVETVFHRKRYLPDVVSHNAVVRSYAERNAINAPIQGTAADIIKIAMVNIFKAFEKENLKAKMIIQVHDELNFVVPVNEIDRVKAVVREEMENAAHFSVPLKADIGIGKNWLEAH